MRVMKARVKKDPPKFIPMPPDLLEALEDAGKKIGITRNATLILAARKGLTALTAEYTQPSEATA
mgnify:CR=1 FL=1